MSPSLGSPQSVQKAMLMVGLNPSDQECVDIPNEHARCRGMMADQIVCR